MEKRFEKISGSSKSSSSPFIHDRQQKFIFISFCNLNTLELYLFEEKSILGMKFLMRNALGSNHVSEGILIKSISFDSLFLFEFKTFKIQTWSEPWFWTWTWGYENSEDGETNPQDFKVTKNFSLHINLLRLDFFYKALEKDKKSIWQKIGSSRSDC